MQESPALAPDAKRDEAEAIAAMQRRRESLPKQIEPERPRASTLPMKARYTEEQRLKDEADSIKRKRSERFSQLIRQAGGDRYAEHGFGNYTLGCHHQKMVFMAVHDWASDYPKMRAERRGLVLYGPVGTGKDHLLFAAIREAVLFHDATATWQNGRDLFGEVRDRISEERSERDLIAKYEHSDILVLSDPVPVVGALTAHQADMLYRIIENRYAAGKLTCATLNIADDDDADAKIGAPTWDRLIDGAIVAECRWPSHRKPFSRISVGK